MCELADIFAQLRCFLLCLLCAFQLFHDALAQACDFGNANVVEDLIAIERAALESSKNENQSSILDNIHEG